jgi:hypothetical protein
MSGLASRQAALVAALVAGGTPPPGFDPAWLRVARTALLHKRAGEVARHWPLLATGLGRRWPREFVAWAASRPPRGAQRDGWDFARALALRGELPALSRTELRAAEARWRYDGVSAPVRRGRVARLIRAGWWGVRPRR